MNKKNYKLFQSFSTPRQFTFQAGNNLKSQIGQSNSIVHYPTRNIVALKDNKGLQSPSAASNASFLLGEQAPLQQGIAVTHHKRILSQPSVQNFEDVVLNTQQQTHYLDQEILSQKISSDNQHPLLKRGINQFRDNNAHLTEPFFRDAQFGDFTPINQMKRSAYKQSSLPHNNSVQQLQDSVVRGISKQSEQQELVKNLQDCFSENETYEKLLQQKPWPNSDLQQQHPLKKRGRYKTNSHWDINAMNLDKERRINIALSLQRVLQLYERNARNLTQRLSIEVDHLLEMMLESSSRYGEDMRAFLHIVRKMLFCDQEEILSLVQQESNRQNMSIFPYHVCAQSLLKQVEQLKSKILERDRFQVQIQEWHKQELENLGIQMQELQKKCEIEKQKFQEDLKEEIQRLRQKAQKEESLRVETRVELETVQLQMHASTTRFERKREKCRVYKYLHKDLKYEFEQLHSKLEDVQQEEQKLLKQIQDLQEHVQEQEEEIQELEEKEQENEEELELLRSRQKNYDEMKSQLEAEIQTKGNARNQMRGKAANTQIIERNPGSSKNISARSSHQIKNPINFTALSSQQSAKQPGKDNARRASVAVSSIQGMFGAFSGLSTPQKRGENTPTQQSPSGNYVGNSAANSRDSSSDRTFQN